MKKLFGIVALIATIMLASIFTGCLSTSGAGKASDETTVIAGSIDDPFKNTAWNSKGVTLLEFGSDGKVAFGYTEVTYTVKKSGEGYVATFKPVRKMTFSIASKDSQEGINDQGLLKIKCTRK